MTAHSREERLEHNLRGLVAAHIDAKSRLSEPVDATFLKRLLEEDDAMGSDEVKLGWGERTLRVRGVMMLVVFGLFAAFATLLWINYQGFVTISTQVAAASEEHKKLDAWMESIVYVLTLSDEQRQTMRLQMPEKIRDMERRR